MSRNIPMQEPKSLYIFPVGVETVSAEEQTARWSLRMLADKVVELQYIDRISHEAVRRILKKKKLNPGKK